MDLHSISSSTVSSLSPRDLSSNNASANLTTEDKPNGTNSAMAKHSLPHKLSSSDFAEQIKQLEIEGNKLRTSSANIFENSTSAFSPYSEAVGTSQISRNLSTNLSSLSSLIDIGSEQKTIADLRVQLDHQQRETEQLQSHLLHEGVSGRGFVTVRPAFSTVSESTRTPFEFVPPSHLERALKESQEQLTHLRKKLYEMSEKAESEKRQFRINIEELRAKLHETIVNRDTILELRQKEAVSHELLISKLQSTVQDLHSKYQTTEKALTDVTKKLEVCTESNVVMETAIKQVKVILVEKEAKRGKPYFESDPVCEQKYTMLSHTLQRCVEELETEIETKSLKLTAMEEEVNILKMSAQEKEKLLTQIHQETLKKETENATKRAQQLSTDWEQQLESASERAKNARSQVSALQSQLTLLENQLDQQVKLKDETISELESKISQLKLDYGEDRTKWQQRREALEHDLDEVRRELATVRSEREEFSHRCVAIETHNEHLQSSLSHLQIELESERNRNVKHREREETLHTKLMSTEMELSHKQQDIDRLEKMLEVVKQECSNQIKDRVAAVEETERVQREKLETQLSSLTEQHHKVNLELESAKRESAELKHQTEVLTQTIESYKSKLDTALSDKQHLSETVSDLRTNVERVEKERDYYLSLVDQKNEVLSRVTDHKETLTVQLEEKTLNLLTLKQQSENISQLVEVNSRTSENIREEKERILSLLSEKTAALRELEMLHENLSKKVKLREKRIGELEEERQKLTIDLNLRTEQTNMVTHEKEKLFSELKESRFEVACVKADIRQCKEELTKQKNTFDKELAQLQSKLKRSENDLILAQKAVRSKQCLDNKAVRYADKMQKEITNKRSEVDSLLSKVRRLEDKLDVLIKEKCSIEKDKDELKRALLKSISNSEHLSEQLENCICKNKKLEENITQLEAAVDKAMLKTDSRSQMESFLQEMTRAKINHQLNLKEAEQTAHTKTQYIVQPAPSVVQNPASTVQPHPSSVQPCPSSVQSCPSTVQPRPSSVQSCPSSVQPRPSSVQLCPSSVQSSSVLEPQILEQDGGYSNRGKLQTDDRKKPASPSSKGYREIGQEFKLLLSEMRNLIAGQREVNQSAKSSSKLTANRMRSEK